MICGDVLRIAAAAGRPTPGNHVRLMGYIEAILDDDQELNGR